LIGTIQNDLVKSAELGILGKQLKILKRNFTAAAFINNMKRMVDALVYEVRSETTRANISHVGSIQNKKLSREESNRNCDWSLSEM
jgi:DNA topoisomerase-3